MKEHRIRKVGNHCCETVTTTLENDIQDNLNLFSWAIAIYFWLQNKQSIVFEVRDVFYLHSQIMKIQMLQTGRTLSHSKFGDPHYQRQNIRDKVKVTSCDGFLLIICRLPLHCKLPLTGGDDLVNKRVYSKKRFLQ